MHGLATVNTAAVGIRLGAILGIFDQLDEVFVDWDDAALGTQLNFSLPVVCVSNSSTMSLKLALSDEDELSD